MLARFFGDPIWWLYLNWLPLYLHNARHVSVKSIALSAWVPFLAADLGCVAGGWLSGFLLGRGWSVNGARKTAIVIGTLWWAVDTRPGLWRRTSPRPLPESA